MATGKSHRNRFASIIIVPPERDQPLNFNLPSWAYYLLLGGLGAAMVVLIGGVVLTGWLGGRLAHMREVEARNAFLEEEVTRVGELERELGEIDDMRLRVLELVGVDVRDEIETRAAVRARAADGYRTLAGVSPAGSVATPLISGANTTRGTMPSLWPVEGVISNKYRVDGDPSTMHEGIDIAASFRSEVRASGAGMVVFAGRDSVFGQLVVIDHGKSVTSYYGHNSSIEVGQGDRVRRGDTVARVGSTGESSAPHLHFEVRKGGKPINPRSYLVE